MWGSLIAALSNRENMKPNPRKFLIADTHFGHKKVIVFEKDFRPFETIEQHDDELVYRWNSVVRSCDTVWHLGDVLFGEKSFETLGRLNGIKKLVMGNHDVYPAAKYLEHFSQIMGAARVSDVILTHIPVHPQQLWNRFIGNIHGHLHSRELDDDRYFNVSAEQNDLTPILFDEVVDTLRKRHEEREKYAPR